MLFSRLIEATAFFYALFDFFCALIMAIILYTTLSDVEHTNKRSHLIGVLVALIIYCFVDVFWNLAYNGVRIPRTVFTRYLTNILKYTMLMVCSYTICRFLFSIWEYVLNKRLSGRRYIFIPFALTILVIVTTPLTHLTFSINQYGVLIKGPLYFISTVILFGTIVVFGIISFIFSMQTENDLTKEQYKLVTIYTIPVVLGGIIHYKLWMVPTVTIGFTFATLIIYIFQMRDLTTLDALTGISNRRQGERFFIEQIHRINTEPHSAMLCLYIFMMDLNKFKAINDNYGHNEGDRALIAVAQVLREACAQVKRHCVISRFGGDEFVIGVMFTPDEANLLNERIYELIEQKNKELSAPYKLSISIGFTYYKRDFKDFRTFLSHADKLMYEVKEIAHRESDLEENKK